MARYRPDRATKFSDLNLSFVQEIYSEKKLLLKFSKLTPKLSLMLQTTVCMYTFLLITYYTFNPFPLIFFREYCKLSYNKYHVNTLLKIYSEIIEQSQQINTRVQAHSFMWWIHKYVLEDGKYYPILIRNHVAASTILLLPKKA